MILLRPEIDTLPAWGRIMISNDEWTMRAKCLRSTSISSSTTLCPRFAGDLTLLMITRGGIVPGGMLAEALDILTF
jgi:hypothetical protein